MTTITLGVRLTHLGQFAFSGCENLASLYFMGNAPTSYGGGVFLGCEKATVYYLSTASGWEPPLLGFPPEMMLAPFNYTANPTNGSVPLTVQFSSPGVDGAGNTITSWNWNFGDDTAGTVQNPSHTYTNAGTFSPALVATNSLGGTVTGVGPGLIRATNSTILFAASPTAGMVPLTVNFTSPGVDNAGNSITRWNWTFGDGATSTAKNPSHTYGTTGSFSPTLIATNTTSGTVLGSGPEITAVAPIPPTCFTYTTNNGAITITAYTCSGGPVSVPSTINGYPVTGIGANAFAYISGPTSIAIPNSVTNIAGGAFAGCYTLTAITVDPSNSFYSSLTGVLFDKNQITLVTCPTGLSGAYSIPNGVTSIGYAAFFASALTNVTIPNSVTSIGGWAFDGSSMGTITIPDSVISIGTAAFQQCDLTTITIPSSVTSVASAAFDDCVALTNVTFPNSVSSIGNYAFSDCPLTSVTIPGSVTSIEDYAFANCSNLTSAYFQGNAPSADCTVFTNDNSATLYYLPGTTGWSNPWACLPAAELNVIAFTANPTNGAVPLTVTFAAPGVDGAEQYHYQLELDVWRWYKRQRPRSDSHLYQCGHFLSISDSHQQSWPRNYRYWPRFNYCHQLYPSQFHYHGERLSGFRRLGRRRRDLYLGQFTNADGHGQQRLHVLELDTEWQRSELVTQLHFHVE